MAKTTEVQEAPSEQAEEGLPAAECCLKPVHSLQENYSGQGGSYILDSSTGLQKLVEQTKPATTEV